jgi:aspartyl-tRNA(Asn)/glutamyl-tRNA(Gln) amidotransferase subunit A
MALEGLAASRKMVGSDRNRAVHLAQQAADAARPFGGEGRSFISIVEDVAAAAAQSPTSDALLGCIFSVKDNIDQRGLVSTCGSALYANGPAAAEDAVVVKQMRAAGAISIGKNNMHELALGATGINARFGTTTNPWDTSRGVGGSSGGSALAVALRQVHVAFGTDSGGSVRLPAAMCGVVGFKPSPGWISLAGVVGAAWTIDCVGVFTEDVPSAAAVWDAIGPAQPAPQNRAQRLAYLKDQSMGRVQPPVWERYLATVEDLRRAGFDLTGISIDGLAAGPQICISVAYAEIASLHYEQMRKRAELYDPAILALLYLGELWSGRNYVDAQRARSMLEARFRRIIEPFDAVLTPTLAVQPPKIGEPAAVAGDAPDAELYTLMRFTVTFNVIGYPAISVPAGLDRDGLPFGLQAVGKPGRDRILLGVAKRLEHVLGAMPPPPSARHPP